MMAKRALVSLCVFALATGIALIMIGSPQRNSLVSPGPLTPQHSTIAHQCSHCHAAGDGQLSDWIHSALNASSAAKKQSQLCLRCHSDLGKHALQPHSQDVEVLAEITRRIDDDGATGSWSLAITTAKAGVNQSIHANLTCATCHREHHGTKHDLTELTNQQCQVCHTKAFHGFGQGHPEFFNYPYQRRTRIYFDHNSHKKHFYTRRMREQGNSKTGLLSFSDSCNQCHVTDAAGQHMLVRSFEQTCAECHKQQIEEDLLPGFVLAALPAVDVDSLRERNIDIGYWPPTYPLHVAAGDTAGLFQWMVPPEVAKSIEGVDLSDLQDSSPDQLAAVESYIWLLKEHFYDIVKNGEDLNDRFAVNQFARLIPNRAIVDLQERWLPGLLGEVESRRSGDALPVQSVKKRDPETVVQEESRNSKLTESGWYLQDSDLSLRYRVTGHADELIQSWLDVTVGHVSSLPTNAAAEDDKPALGRFSPFSSGRCLKCHTIDDGQINWHTKQPLPSKSFTQFRHKPHITVLNKNECGHCHDMNDRRPQESLFLPEFVSANGSVCTNPDEFESNFAPLVKNKCVKCHTSSGAGDRCLSCHNYHITGH